MGNYLSETIKLIKFIKNSSWDDDPQGILKQLSGVGEKMANNLIQADVTNFEI